MERKWQDSNPAVDSTGSVAESTGIDHRQVAMHRRMVQRKAKHHGAHGATNAGGAAPGGAVVTHLEPGNAAEVAARLDEVINQWAPAAVAGVQEVFNENIEKRIAKLEAGNRESFFRNLITNLSWAATAVLEEPVAVAAAGEAVILAGSGPAPKKPEPPDLSTVTSQGIDQVLKTATDNHGKSLERATKFLQEHPGVPGVLAANQLAPQVVGDAKLLKLDEGGGSPPVVDEVAVKHAIAKKVAARLDHFEAGVSSQGKNSDVPVISADTYACWVGSKGRRLVVLTRIDSKYIYKDDVASDVEQDAIARTRDLGYADENGEPLVVDRSQIFGLPPDPRLKNLQRERQSP